MKNLIPFILLTFITYLPTTNAQISVRAGVNIASMSANATEKNYSDYQNISVVGFQAALALPIKISENIAIQPELVFIQKGGKFQYIADEKNKFISTLKTNYFEIPVSLKIGLGGNSNEGLGVYILAGPYLGIALNSTYTNELTVLGATSSSTRTVDYSNDSNQEKRVDWGANIGAGVSFGNIFVDVRYNLGINNLLDNNASNNDDNKPYRRNRGIGLSLGLRF